jgi:hypothetical protein
MRMRTLAALLLMGLLSGCGGPAGAGEPDIATMQSGRPGSAAPSAVRERPVIRPDEGREAFDRYVEIYHQCLRERGIKVGTGEKPEIDINDANQAVAEQCWHLYPETWMDRERRTNPEFVDRLREVAQCLLSKGHDVTVGGDPVSVMYGDNTSANKAYEDEQECQRQAFKDSIKQYNQR